MGSGILIRILIALLFCVPALAHASYAGRPEVQAFVDDLAQRHGFVKTDLKRVFAKAQRLDPVLEAIARPAERVRTWEEYRALLITERRIAASTASWRRAPENTARNSSASKACRSTSPRMNSCTSGCSA